MTPTTHDYQYIRDAHADLRAGRITQQQLDRIVSRQHQYLVTVPHGKMNRIIAIYGASLEDLAARCLADTAGGDIHYVCCYGHAFNCGGTI